jgi:hypothetical protein
MECPTYPYEYASPGCSSGGAAQSTAKGTAKGAAKGTAKGMAKGTARGIAGSKASHNVDIRSDMVPESKQVLLKHIYELLLANKFTSPDGYLLTDVFEVVWKDIGDSDGTAGGRHSLHQRFVELLRAAPQYFKVFRPGLTVMNNAGWFARKGERMVRLVLPDEDEDVSNSSRETVPM